MKNSTLIFRSFIVVFVIVGTAHFFSTKTEAVSDEVETKKMDEPDVYKDTVKQKEESRLVDDKVTYMNEEVKSAKKIEANMETDYIIGNWKVELDTDEFKGAIVYDLKKEKDVFKAYTLKYIQAGESELADKVMTLSIESFDGYKGVGVYHIEFEDEKYEVPCQIDMVDENTFKLSYDYYGCSDTETWKRY